MDVSIKIKDFINDSIQPLYGEIEKRMKEVCDKADSNKRELQTLVMQSSEAEQNRINDLNKVISQLNGNVIELIDQVGLLQDAVDALRDKIQVLETRKKEASPDPLKPTVRVLYSKMVDSMDPLGFRISNLKDSPEGCAFRITLRDEQEGFYENVEDGEIQKEMLSVFEPIITNSSVFELIPQDVTRIVVVNQGKLVKEDNILRITEKQKIKFE